MHSGGKTICLESENYTAKIVTVGAGLAELQYKGHHLVIPHNPEEMPLAHLGKVMIPWPNRLANGVYRFNNIEYKLPINEHTTNAALHGLLAWREWSIKEQTKSKVVLEILLPPSYGYPFLLKSSVTYMLDNSNGLTMLVTSKNIGNTAAPYGVATHPYLTCDLELIDNCELNIPAKQVFAVDDKLNPTDLLSVKDQGLDFIEPKTVNNTFIDNTFKAESNNWEIKLKSIKSQNVTYMRSNQPWIQIYSGEKLNRLGLAVEPMSCPPDAFNSQIGLIILKPNDEYTLTLTIGGY